MGQKNDDLVLLIRLLGSIVFSTVFISLKRIVSEKKQNKRGTRSNPPPHCHPPPQERSLRQPKRKNYCLRQQENEGEPLQELKMERVQRNDCREHDPK